MFANAVRQSSPCFAYVDLHRNMGVIIQWNTLAVQMTCSHILFFSVRLDMNFKEMLRVEIKRNGNKI